MSAFWLIVSGAIVAFGQPVWGPWIAPVAAVCGYALFWRVASGRRHRFFWGAVWFFFVQLIQLAWMTSIEFQGIYILFVYGAIALGLGLQFGLLTHLINRIPLVASAALWALLEWSRLYVLCGFSFNPVGLALTTTAFSLQCVTFFGIFGLSFLVILTNLAVWKRRWKPAAVLALSPYMLGAIQWTLHHPKLEKSPTMNIALIQTALLPSQKMYFSDRPTDYVSPYEQWNRIAKLASNIQEPVDLLVLPESAVPYTNHYPLYSKEHVTDILHNSFQDRMGAAEDHLLKVSNLYWMHSLSKIIKSDVIIGLDGEEGDLHYSSAFFASRGDVARYDKQILLPLAEYLPFDFLKNFTSNYGIKEFFTKGSKPRIFHSKVPISASICYEETFGHILRQGRAAGAQLFVNVTNDNWYPHSNLPKHHFDLAKAQAVANGTPLVRACNSGVTSAVDCLGQVIAKLDDWNKPATLLAKVPLLQVWTFYSFWGDRGIVAVSIIMLTLSVIINRKSLVLKDLMR